MKKQPYNPYSTKPDFYGDKDPLKQAPREAPICQRVRENMEIWNARRRKLIHDRNMLTRLLGAAGADIDDIRSFEREVEDAASLPDLHDIDGRSKNANVAARIARRTVRRIIFPDALRSIFSARARSLLANVTLEGLRAAGEIAGEERRRLEARVNRLGRQYLAIDRALQQVKENQRRACADYRRPENRCVREALQQSASGGP